jgi:regulatory protein
LLLLNNILEIIMTEIREKALDLLARREHSRLELGRKLKTRGFNENEIEAVLDGLKNSGLQSDERFVESYITSRKNKGYGLVRIRQELKERGVASELIEDYLFKDDEQWIFLAQKVKLKRFGSKQPSDFKEKAKQSVFLQYRGFTSDQIKQIL